MTRQKIQAVLGWCSIINIGLLIWWLLAFIFARDLMLRFHGLLFDIPAQTFDAIHYAGMAFFKILIFVFNVVPYIALRILGGGEAR